MAVPTSTKPNPPLPPSQAVRLAVVPAEVTEVVALLTEIRDTVVDIFELLADTLSGEDQ